MLEAFREKQAYLAAQERIRNQEIILRKRERIRYVPVETPSRNGTKEPSSRDDTVYNQTVNETQVLQASMYSERQVRDGN